MKRGLLIASALAALLVLIACQASQPPPAPPIPTPTTEQAASGPTPAAPSPTPAPTFTPVPQRPPADPTATAEPTAIIVASPDPTPTPAPVGPTVDDVPPTDGPVMVPAMASRDHFAPNLRISQVVPDGYSTVPPTSGQHWGAWSDCGFYNHPLPDELLVHNLEHGNIIVSYNLSDDEDVAALRAAVEDIPIAEEFAIVRRYLAIPEGMVAVTTWGVLDRMMGVDAERIANFFDAFPGNTGPEFPTGLPCTTGIQMTQSSGG